MSVDLLTIDIQSIYRRGQVSPQWQEEKRRHGPFYSLEAGGAPWQNHWHCTCNSLLVNTNSKIMHISIIFELKWFSLLIKAPCDIIVVLASCQDNGILIRYAACIPSIMSQCECPVSWQRRSRGLILYLAMSLLLILLHVGLNCPSAQWSLE